VRTAVRRGGQFCRSLVENLLKYLCAKSYENIMMSDKVIAKIIRVQFCLPYSVDVRKKLGLTANVWHVMTSSLAYFRKQ